MNAIVNSSGGMSSPCEAASQPIMTERLGTRSFERPAGAAMKSARMSPRSSPVYLPEARYFRARGMMARHRLVMSLSSHVLQSLRFQSPASCSAGA